MFNPTEDGVDQVNDPTPDTPDIIPSDEDEDDDDDDDDDDFEDDDDDDDVIVDPDSGEVIPV